MSTSPVEIHSFYSTMNEEKRNERVQSELDERKEQLARAKAEYDKLKSTAVSFFLFV